MILSLIVAMDENQLIGDANGLPWSIPEDLRYFRETTLGHEIIMGRKTFESIGQVLPGRNNYILTRQHDLEVEGAVVETDPAALLEGIDPAAGEVFVIGGREIYDLFYPSADRLYVTHVNGCHEGDTIWQGVDWDEWLCESIEDGAAAGHYHIIYKRKGHRHERK